MMTNNKSFTDREMEEFDKKYNKFLEEVYVEIDTNKLKGFIKVFIKSHDKRLEKEVMKKFQSQIDLMQEEMKGYEDKVKKRLLKEIESKIENKILDKYTKGKRSLNFEEVRNIIKNI